MSLMDKLSKMFSKKSTTLPQAKQVSQQESVFESTYEVLSINPNVYLCNKAARLSVGKEAYDTEEGRLKHIQMLVNKGHESVLEHSNVVAIVNIPLDEDSMFPTEAAITANTLSHCKYLNVVIRHTSTCMHILIGGSIRGYLHLLREDIESFGSLYDTIRRIVYESIQKDFLVKLIDQNLLEEQYCTYVGEVDKAVTSSSDDDLVATANLRPDPQIINGTHADLVYAQPFIDIYNKVSIYGFDVFDVLKVTTISFLFHDISRAIGNQLVRHRDAITQQSQRYVLQDFNKESFIDPIKRHLKDKDTKYSKLDESVLSYLEKQNPFRIYKYLINKGVAKEDARMWLPLGVSTKIFMTFTYHQLFKFLELRLANGAQYEIRGLANECKSHLIDLFKLSDETYQFLYLYSIMPSAIRFGRITDDEYKKHVGSMSTIKLPYSYNIDDEEENIDEIKLTRQDVKPKVINTIEEAEQYLKESSKSSDKDAK